MRNSIIRRGGRTAAILATSASVVAALQFAEAPVLGQNLLANGNFNTDSEPNSQPDGWSNWSYGSTSFAAYKNDPSHDPWDFDGTPYVNAGNYGEWWSSGGGWYQVVAGAPDIAYSLSIECGTEDWDNAAGEIRLIFLDGANAEIRRDLYHTAEYQSKQPWSPYLMTSVAPAGTTQVKAEVATSGARGSVMWDDANLNVASVWNVNASGSFFTASNWIGGAPNGVDTAARFLGVITSEQTIFIDSPVTLGSLGFDNTNSYVLAGAASLTLQTTAGPALVDVKQGSQRINLPLTIASDTKLNVLTGATLRILNPLTISAGKRLVQTGGGVVSYESSIDLQSGASIVFGNTTRATALSLGSAAQAQVAPHGTAAAKVLTVTSLAIASDAKLDVTDNPFIVDYSGASPITAIRTMLKDGQLTSSIAPAAQQLGYIENSALLGAGGGTFAGETVDGTAVLTRLTFAGDATMDGKVDVADLGILATNWQLDGVLWSAGDFNYDGLVNVADLGILATNWQLGTGGATAPAFSDAVAAVGLSGVSVPEPAATGAILLSAMCLMPRTRRRIERTVL